MIRRAPGPSPPSRPRPGSPTRLPVIALAFSLVYGTVGYVVIGGFSVLHAVYMTVASLTTVGFGEIEPLDAAGGSSRSH